MNHTLTVFFLFMTALLPGDLPYPCLAQRNCATFARCQKGRCVCADELTGNGEQCKARKKLFPALYVYRRIFADVIDYIFSY